MIRHGRIEIDERRREIRNNGRVVLSQRKSLDLILYLLKARPRVVPREELLEALWPGTRVVNSALAHAILAARRSLGDDSLILTVRGVGYRFGDDFTVAHGGESCVLASAGGQPAAGRIAVEFGGTPMQGCSVFSGEHAVAQAARAALCIQRVLPDVRLSLATDVDPQTAMARASWMLARNASGIPLDEGTIMRLGEGFCVQGTGHSLVDEETTAPGTIGTNTVVEVGA